MLIWTKLIFLNRKSLFLIKSTTFWMLNQFFEGMNHFLVVVSVYRIFIQVYMWNFLRLRIIVDAHLVGKKSPFLKRAFFFLSRIKLSFETQCCGKLSTLATLHRFSRWIEQQEWDLSYYDDRDRDLVFCSVEFHAHNHCLCHFHSLILTNKKMPFQDFETWQDSFFSSRLYKRFQVMYRVIKKQWLGLKVKTNQWLCWINYSMGWLVFT